MIMFFVSYKLGPGYEFHLKWSNTFDLLWMTLIQPIRCQHAYKKKSWTKWSSGSTILFAFSMQGEAKLLSTSDVKEHFLLYHWTSKQIL